MLSECLLSVGQHVETWFCLRICLKWRICFCRNVDFMEIFSEDTLVFWHLEKY